MTDEERDRPEKRRRRYRGPQVPEGMHVRYQHYRYRDSDVLAALRTVENEEAGHVRPHDLVVNGFVTPLVTYEEQRAEVLSPTGGVTIAHVFDADDNEVATGVAECSILDNFNRARGRMIALGRALRPKRGPQLVPRRGRAGDDPEAAEPGSMWKS